MTCHLGKVRRKVWILWQKLWDITFRNSSLSVPTGKRSMPIVASRVFWLLYFTYLEISTLKRKHFRRHLVFFLGCPCDTIATMLVHLKIFGLLDCILPSNMAAVLFSWFWEATHATFKKNRVQLLCLIPNSLTLLFKYLFTLYRCTWLDYTLRCVRAVLLDEVESPLTIARYSMCQYPCSFHLASAWNLFPPSQSSKV